MATLVRDIERPAFLDRPADGQLSLGGAITSHEAPSERGGPAACPAARVPLSDRLRSERTARATAQAQTGVARGGEATLDELFVGAWEGLSARRPVTCPVCAGPMLPRAGTDGGACADCRAQLR